MKESKLRKNAEGVKIELLDGLLIDELGSLNLR